MALTALDPKTALVVVDLQKGILSLGLAHLPGKIVEHAAALCDAFRRKGLPVVLVNVAGGAPGRAEQSPNLGELPADWLEFAPELDRQPQDHVVTKRTWGAFTGTDLEAWLRDQDVTQVVICGVATSIGVESTARFAHELGFNVTLAVDAMTDRHGDSHDYAIKKIFPRLGETGSTAEILALLETTHP